MKITPIIMVFSVLFLSCAYCNAETNSTASTTNQANLLTLASEAPVIFVGECKAVKRTRTRQLRFNCEVKEIIKGGDKFRKNDAGEVFIFCHLMTTNNIPDYSKALAQKDYIFFVETPGIGVPLQMLRDDTEKAIHPSTPENLTAIRNHLKMNAELGVQQSSGIAWKTHENGLALGVKLAKDPNVGDIPAFTVYLANCGTHDIGDLIAARHRFVLELNGKFYAMTDYGGKHCPLRPNDDEWYSFPVISITTEYYGEIKNLSMNYGYYGAIDKNSRPTIKEGINRMMLHYRIGWTAIVYRATGELVIKK
jgi:hypothetical protein